MQVLILLTQDLDADEQDFRLQLTGCWRSITLETVVFRSLECLLEWLILFGKIPLPDNFPTHLEHLQTTGATNESEMNYLKGLFTTNWLLYQSDKPETVTNVDLTPSGKTDCSFRFNTCRDFFSNHMTVYGAHQIPALGAGFGAKLHYFREYRHILVTARFGFQSETSLMLGDLVYIDHFDFPFDPPLRPAFGLKHYRRISRSFTRNTCIVSVCTSALEADLFFLSAMIYSPLLDDLWTRCSQRYTVKPLNQIVESFVSHHIVENLKDSLGFFSESDIWHYGQAYPKEKATFVDNFTSMVREQTYPWVGHYQSLTLASLVLEIRLMECCLRNSSARSEIPLKVKLCRSH